MRFTAAFLSAALVAVTTSSAAVADADLEQKMANPANWASQAGDDANLRWSDLKQINAENVGKLQVAWTMSTGTLRGHEGSPLVIGDTMYIHTPFPNNVYAVNLKDQTYKWKYEPKQDNDVIPVMCCDTVNRGLAYGDGKIFLQQADTTLVALDAATGEVVWTAGNGNPKVGELTRMHRTSSRIKSSPEFRVANSASVAGSLHMTSNRASEPGLHGVRARIMIC